MYLNKITMKFNELEKHSFVEAPEELVKMVGECPSVFHTLLPYSQNPFFVKSKGGGYMLLKGANHYINGMVFGNVTREDFNIDDPMRWFFNTDSNDGDESDYQLFDFRFEMDAEKVKKYKRKHSCNRIVKDANITVDTYVGFDFMFAIDNNPYEIENLLETWAKNSNSDVTIKLRNITTHLYNQSKNMVRFAYRCNGVLSGLQVFEIVGNNIYWLVNVCLFGDLTKSHLHRTYPIEYFNYKPIHRLGALPKQDNLFRHKMEECDGKYWKFKKFIVPSEQQSKKKREIVLNEMYNYLGI